MIRLGLTGSIGMGKSTTAQMFRDAGIPVYDADAAVHQLYEPSGAAVAPVVEAFGETILSPEGGIDRARLSALVINDPQALNQLNGLVHPLVAKAQIAFDTQAKQSGAPLAVFDVPLLFEGGSDRLMDVVAVVTAPQAVQLSRVLSRQDMNENKLEAILKRQMPDAEKQRRAHFVIETGFGLAYARAQVQALIAAVLAP
jgi:dephospho-CoA kinase